MACGRESTTFLRPQTGWLDFGENVPDEKERALAKSVDVAVENGISTEGRQTLLGEFDDVLRILLGHGPPADVTPMVGLDSYCC